jgi:hypothetical protein
MACLLVSTIWRKLWPYTITVESKLEMLVKVSFLLRTFLASSSVFLATLLGVENT